MKSMLKLLMFLMIGSMVMPVYSQGFLDRVAKKAKEKAEQKAEERVEQKMDEQIDKGLDNVEDALEGEEPPASETGEADEAAKMNKIRSMMESMNVSSEPIPVADRYHFSSRIKFRYSLVNENGKVKDESEVVTFFSPGEENFAYEFVDVDANENKKNSAGKFIMDFDNNATIVLTEEDGEKSGVVYGIRGWENAFSAFTTDETPTDDTDMVLKPTGRTKYILGYKCEEYVYETDDYEGSAWIAKSVDWLSGNVLSSIFKTDMYDKKLNEGLLMESETRDKEKGTISKMAVTELDENANVSIELTEYELTNLGSVEFKDNLNDD